MMVKKSNPFGRITLSVSEIKKEGNGERGAFDQLPFLSICFVVQCYLNLLIYYELCNALE